MPVLASFPRPRAGATAAALSGVALLLAGGAVPAVARDFAPPAGCALFATVQNQACSVEVLWRCKTAKPGDFWEATFSLDGLESIVSYDGDYQWLDAAYYWDSSSERFHPPAIDPISRDDLLSTGIDTFEFTMQRATPDRDYEIRVIGADMLTGTTMVIDGFALDEVRTRLEIIDEEGTVEYASKGIQYYSRDLGLFFLGAETVFGPDGTADVYDDGPADIILPGEPGFGDTEPLYGCNMQDAAFTPPAPETSPGQAKKETNDDQF